MIQKEDSIDCTELLDALERESFSPNASNNKLSEDLEKKIRNLLRTLLILCSFFALGGVSNAQEPKELYDIAMQTTERQERMNAFASSAKAYQMKLEENPYVGDLWVDWGNASLGAGRYGDAMLGYLRGVALNPRDVRAKQNQAWLAQRLPEWVLGSNQSSSIARLFFWSKWCTQAELLVLGGVVFSLMIVIRLWAPSWLRQTNVFLFLLWFSFVIAFQGKQMEEPLGVVQADAGVLRSSDNEGAPPVRSDWIPEGTVVQLLRNTERWQEVQLGNGDKGWLPRRVIKEVDFP